MMFYTVHIEYPSTIPKLKCTIDPYRETIQIDPYRETVQSSLNTRS